MRGIIKKGTAIDVTDNDLLSEILRLVNLKQEGGYWDFKRQWYEEKEDLLHDIICMANNLENRDAYIIIGVDEEKDYSFSDISNDSNRKSTQNLVDFLKEKKFAGGIRPTVYIDTLTIHGNTIDIIVVKNSSFTPFYLIEHFQGVFENHIYTRIADTNTPKNKSADIDKIEYLWRKRFHINEPPIEKFQFYITKYDDWSQIANDSDLSRYYEYAPEFTVITEKDHDRTQYEYFLFSQYDITPCWYLVTLKYHQTPLKQFQAIALDGGRCFIIAPSYNILSFDKYNQETIKYYFYTKKSFRYDLNLFFLNIEKSCESYQYTSFCESVLFFDTEDEHNDFQKFVLCNKNLYDETYPKYAESSPKHYSQVTGCKKDAFLDDYRNFLTLKDMLSVFKDKN